MSISYLSFDIAKTFPPSARCEDIKKQIEAAGFVAKQIGRRLIAVRVKK